MVCVRVHFCCSEVRFHCRWAYDGIFEGTQNDIAGLMEQPSGFGLITFTEVIVPYLMFRVVVYLCLNPRRDDEFIVEKKAPPLLLKDVEIYIIIDITFFRNITQVAGTTAKVTVASAGHHHPKRSVY